MAAGVQVNMPDWWLYPHGKPQPSVLPTLTTGAANQAQAANKTQGEDYDTIMGGYRSLAGNFPSAADLARNTLATYRPTQMTAAQYAYSPSADVSSSLSGLSGLAQTGGLSAADQQALRERGVSPIRAAYAAAQRNVDRNRALAGGYSPNYAAATAKMAREQSDITSSKMNDINAGIAEMVQKGKLAAAPAYASAAEAENAARTQAGEAQAAREQAAKEFNANA